MGVTKHKFFHEAIFWKTTFMSLREILRLPKDISSLLRCKSHRALTSTCIWITEGKFPPYSVVSKWLGFSFSSSIIRITWSVLRKMLLQLNYMVLSFQGCPQGVTIHCTIPKVQKFSFLSGLLGLFGCLCDLDMSIESLKIGWGAHRYSKEDFTTK